MTETDPLPQRSAQPLRAYDRMLARTRTLLRASEHKTVTALQHSIEVARDTAVELGELTRDEAELIAAYVRRDLEDAGDYLARTGAELNHWLHIDLELIEASLLEMFADAADQTKLVYLELAERARQVAEYRSGEITSVGTLRCAACGKLLHFHATHHIPPCPRCRGSLFLRMEDA